MHEFCNLAEYTRVYESILMQCKAKHIKCKANDIYTQRSARPLRNQQKGILVSPEADKDTLSYAAFNYSAD